MTDQQLYISVGIPVIGILIGVLVNVSWFSVLSSRIQHVETRLDGRIDRLDNRFDRVDARFDRLESVLVSRIDLLTGKVVEIDNRLTRVEEQLKHLH